MKVFISWSGPVSKAVALALRDWLPSVIQAIEPWVSSEDIDKGTQWSQGIAEQLKTTKVGIICLTPQNLTAPWLLFESGAISKSVSKSFVCTYLLGVESSSVQHPLALFQDTKADREDTRKLLRTVNKALVKQSLPLDKLDRAFDQWWPELDKALADSRSMLAASAKPAPPKRSDREILEEILELTRAQERARNSPASTDHFPVVAAGIRNRTPNRFLRSERAALEFAKQIHEQNPNAPPVYGVSGDMLDIGDNTYILVWDYFNAYKLPTATPAPPETNLGEQLEPPIPSGEDEGETAAK